MNIGFMGYYGWSRGLCYLMRSYVKMVENEHTCFILKIGSNEVQPEFAVKAEIESYDNRLNGGKYTVPTEVFRNWITKNKIEHLFLFEYNQWEKNVDLVGIAKSMGVKTYGCLVYERFNQADFEEYKKYTKLIAPTKFFLKEYRSNGFYNAVYVPFGLDLNEFKPTKVTNAKPQFLHIGGWGGVGNRKNTDVIIKAYEQGDFESELVILSQREMNLKRNELIDIINSCDATILPSRWESTGIPLYESLAMGKPIICTDMPVFSEVITDNSEGLLVKSTQKMVKDITCNSNEIDVNDLATKIKIMENKLVRDVMSRNALITANDYDLNKSKKYLLRAIESK
jgi:glycosyltransferase involved in cell wall biosynthesis